MTFQNIPHLWLIQVLTKITYFIFSMRFDTYCTENLIIQTYSNYKRAWIWVTSEVSIFCNSINKWPSAKRTIWLELWRWQQFHKSIIKPLYLSTPHNWLLTWDQQWTGILGNNIKSISLQSYFSQQQISKF